MVVGLASAAGSGCVAMPRAQCGPGGDHRVRPVGDRASDPVCVLVGELVTAQAEIDYLMGLLGDYLDDDLPTLQEHDIRFQVIGQIDRLPDSVRSRALRNVRLTAGIPGSGDVLGTQLRRSR